MECKFKTDASYISVKLIISRYGEVQDTRKKSAFKRVV